MRFLVSTLLKAAIVLAPSTLATSAYAGLIDDYNSDFKNRCGNTVIPMIECPFWQDIAYYGYYDNTGQVILLYCINLTEYNFARNKSIAPLCSSVFPGQYVGWCPCGAQDAVTLAADATLEHLAFATHGIEATTVGDEEKPLVVLSTDNDARLGVTEQHAVLLADGRMVAAVDLVIGDELVAQTGEAVRLESIERVGTDARVYNLLTRAPVADKRGHLVVANGLIVGDLVWQNTLASELGKIAIRR